MAYINFEFEDTNFKNVFNVHDVLIYCYIIK